MTVKLEDWNEIRKNLEDQFCILTIFIKLLQCAIAKVDHSTSNVKKKKKLKFNLMSV